MVFHEEIFPFGAGISVPSAVQFPPPIPVTSIDIEPSEPSFLDTALLSVIPPRAPNLHVTSRGKQIKPPSYLQDYIYGALQTSCPYPLSSF